MGCKDGPVYSTITCTFNFRGAHASLVKKLLVKGRERERKTERMREEEYIDIFDFFFSLRQS